MTKTPEDPQETEDSTTLPEEPQELLSLWPGEPPMTEAEAIQIVKDLEDEGRLPSMVDLYAESGKVFGPSMPEKGDQRMRREEESGQEKDSRHGGSVEDREPEQEDELVISLHLTSIYLEVARAFLGSELTGSPDDLERHRSALVGVTSVQVIYSYLAVEAWLNYQLYQVWLRRHEDHPESRRFLRILEDQDDFTQYKNHPGFKMVKSRIKSLCRIRGWEAPHSAVPNLWRRFNELSSKARHFLVHPNADPETFHEGSIEILSSPLVQWTEVAADLLAFFFRQGGQEPPAWVHGSTLLQIPEVRIRAEEKLDGDQ